MNPNMPSSGRVDVASDAPCACGNGFVVLLSNGIESCTHTLARYEALNGKSYSDALAALTEPQS